MVIQADYQYVDVGRAHASFIRSSRRNCDDSPANSGDIFTLGDGRFQLDPIAATKQLPGAPVRIDIAAVIVGDDDIASKACSNAR